MEKTRGTLKEIAEALNLSEGTVSRALSQRGNLAQGTRDRVVELAATLKYSPRPRPLPSALPLKRMSVCVGNRCADADGRLDASFVGLHVLAQLEQVASAAHIGVMVSFVDAMDPAVRVDQLPSLQAGEVQGVILVYPFPESIVRQLSARMPVVSIEHVYPSTAVDVIGPTHAMDAMCAVEYLHGLGHRRIAYVSDEAATGHQLTLGLRHAGYVSGLNRCGLEYQPADVFNIATPLVSKAELARRVARRVRDGVTAVITSIDRHGYLLWNQLPTVGIKVPRDVSLVGIGGIRRSDDLPQLTTWRCNYESIALAAIDAIRSRIHDIRKTGTYSEIASIFVEGESAASKSSPTVHTVST